MESPTVMILTGLPLTVVAAARREGSKASIWDDRKVRGAKGSKEREEEG